jgi:protein kinase C substrate 80K-H
LGRFSAVEVEAEGGGSGSGSGSGSGGWGGASGSGNTILKYTNGQHCWNHGPREAKVVVSCGSSTRLLTAAEPHTCSYEFTMEDPAACTAAWGRAHNLL